MTFEDIYKRNAWRGIESLSGPGSGSAATGPIIPWIRRIVQEEIILSVLDIGCGDGFWMPDLTVKYTGVDVSLTAIERSHDRHPDREYLWGDASQMRLPRAELVICRDVIQHLSFAEGWNLLANILRSQPLFMLLSTYVGTENRDIRTGDAYSPDLTAEPFSLTAPELLIFDGHYYHEHDTGQVRDPAKYLGLWRLTRP